MSKYVWSLIVISNSEEDDNEPYVVSFDSFEEAEKAYLSYSSELLLNGQRAYSCTPPFSQEVFDNA